jgi:hypothetical protein
MILASGGSRNFSKPRRIVRQIKFSFDEYKHHMGFSTDMDHEDGRDVAEMRGKAYT